MAAGKPTYDELAELVRSQAETIRQQAETIRELTELNRRQAEEIAALRRRVSDLEEQLRSAHRQTAPFRRREKLKKPDGQKKKPGRAKGHPASYRPQPVVIDEQVEVPLPECPHCQGELGEVRKREQFIEELPPIRPRCVKVTTWTGVCPRCGEVESRHPLQTSTAVGAAGVHLGPRAHALAVLLSHHCGLTMGGVCRTLRDVCGLKLSRGGLSHLLQRAATRVQPLFDDLVAQIRGSAAVFADETSWYVGEPKWWLWVFTTPLATLYRVERNRSAEVVLDTLGDFGGMLVSDCLASYDSVAYRQHKCFAHHLRALQEQDEALAKRGIESSYLAEWKRLLQRVIDTCHRRDEFSPADWGTRVLDLWRGTESLLNRSPPEPEEVKFRNRLVKRRRHLLGCLEEPAAEPTNNRAERDLRPAVIDRKLSCGNRTEQGKRAWEVLRSVTTTLHKQGRDLVDALTPRLRLAGQ